ncbi:MAG: carboxypeptidase regulatory-like domain-containing protein [Deltaproteobacteria bacterium]|nr:carboxypeptidase regulatory-like domain-containing protein [Deltaproteobacteria bacterium]
MILALLLACGDDTADTSKTTDSGDTGTTDTQETGETGDYAGAEVNGVVTDPDGAPLPDFRVNVCRSLCMTARTGADGSYTLAGISPEVASYYVQGDETLGYATPYAPITWVVDDVVTIDIQLLELGDSTSTNGSGSYDVGGLHIEFGEGDVMDIYDDPITSVTVTEAPEGTRPPLETSETVLAVYYLAPFEAHGSATVTPSSTWGLAAGSTVNAWYAAEPIESGWVLGGTLTIDEAATGYTGDASLDAFTTLMFTSP